MQLLFQSIQWFEVSHAFTHRRETFCLQAMQLLLQTASRFEEPHKEAHCKSKGMKRQINYSFLLTESSQRYRYSFTKKGFIHKYPVLSLVVIILKSKIWKWWVRKTKQCEAWWLSSLMVQAGFCIIIITLTCVIFWGHFVHMEILNRIVMPRYLLQGFC